tara:strand:- start:1580 stop:1843 length:264 start_codon:yes stop_codon:yes gene_type:complete
MRVSELKVGELYKIRSDRKTHVLVRRGMLDVHVGHGHFEAEAKIRPFDHLVYLGGIAGSRRVMYRGEKLRVYPNVWQHIVPLEDDIS